MKLNGAQLVIETLQRHGVGIVAGIPGGANLPLYDALGQSPLRHVLARHEQGAGFIAQGMARASVDQGILFRALKSATAAEIPLRAIVRSPR